jgi:hypothetical protein
LQAENKKQKKKRANRRLYIATGDILTVQEKLDLLQIANKGLQDRVAIQEATVKTCMLYIYSCQDQSFRRREIDRIDCS